MTNSTTKTADASTILGWYYPHNLRAGDMIHVDALTLSSVASTAKGRAGTEVIALTDGRQITVCGGTRIAVFVP